MLRSKVIEFCNSLGLDTVGCIKCRRFDELVPFYENRKNKKLQNEFEEEEIENRINPMRYMEDGKTILSIAFPYYFPEEEMKENGFSIYTKRRDYHVVVKQYMEQIIRFIESLGGKAVGLVDSNSLPERYIAYLAGIGFIGRNNMIITKKYGSYVFLGEVITNLRLYGEETHKFSEIARYEECGECRNCYTECPTKSINHGQVNPNICLSYLTQKKELSEKEIALLKGNVFGCDFCQFSCPYNERVKASGLKEFARLEYMDSGVDCFARMNTKYFKEKISPTSCGWRGKNVIKRNAMIRLARQGEPIDCYKGESEYLNQYIDLLMK